MVCSILSSTLRLTSVARAADHVTVHLASQVAEHGEQGCWHARFASGFDIVISADVASSFLAPHDASTTSLSALAANYKYQGPPGKFEQISVLPA